MIAGIVSAQGAARALLLLAEDGKILISVSEQVIVEDPDVARRSGLRIGIPGDGLAWARDQLSKTA